MRFRIGEVGENALAIFEESLAFLTTPNPCMRVADFLARIGIVTISDRASAGIYEDKSGPRVMSLMPGSSVLMVARMPRSRKVFSGWLG